MHYICRHFKSLLLFLLHCGCAHSDQVTRWTQINVNSGLYGPLTETKQVGNRIVLEYEIVLPPEKCCPGLVMTDGPLGHVFTTHRCYDIDQNVLDDIYEFDRGRLVKLDWEFQHWRDESDDQSQGCFFDGGQNYTCYGKLDELYPSYVRGEVYLFYPCFANLSLEALYQVSIYAKNKTESDTKPHDETGCTMLSPKSTCSKYYTHKRIPNFAGHWSINEANKALSSASGIVSSKCHQHIEEFVCRVLLPQCPASKAALPCKSMCVEITDACRQQMDTLQNALVKGKMNFKFLRDYWCGQLPENNGCFQKNVTCGMPRKISEGKHDCKQKFSILHSVATYTCRDDFTLEGNATVVCQYSGEWSEPPKCIAMISNKVILIICFVCCSVLILIVTFIILVYKYRKDIAALLYVKLGFNLHTEIEEDRLYDAFIAYSREDIDFVRHILLEPLENAKPSFAICIRDRDFNSGDWISQNIIRSVQQSRRTIIVLSQSFVNSQWCQFEFAQAHLQLLEDQSFKLLVIALEDPKTLRNVPELIQHYIQTRTYLWKDDNLFWEKLIYQMPKRRK